MLDYYFYFYLEKYILCEKVLLNIVLDSQMYCVKNIYYEKGARRTGVLVVGCVHYIGGFLQNRNRLRPP
jgi:hypothetical protein